MRKLAFFFLALNFLLTPMASSLAMAVGLSGEHVHFDTMPHNDAEIDHDNTSSNDHLHDTAPIKHTHGEAHSGIFIAPDPTEMVLLKLASAKAPMPLALMLHEHPYPPFRPPQRA